MKRNEWERKVFADQVETASKWLYRAVIMSKVLEHLGYSTANVMNGDAATLAGYVYKEAAEIMRCLQMEAMAREERYSMYQCLKCWGFFVDAEGTEHVEDGDTAARNIVCSNCKRAEEEEADEAT